MWIQCYVTNASFAEFTCFILHGPWHEDLLCCCATVGVHLVSYRTDTLFAELFFLLYDALFSVDGPKYQINIRMVKILCQP
jgi:hypothetical protein